MARAGAPPLAREGRRAVENVPLFPLNTVLFPGGRLPLRIFEQRYLEMAKTCLKEGLPFGVCLIRKGHEVGAAAVPAEVGCLARIAAWDMEQLGLLEIVARGEQRFRILERSVQDDGLARARIELVPPEADAAIPPGCETSVRLLERLIAQHGEIFEPPHLLHSSAWVSARLAEILPLPLARKQELLEISDARVRLERLTSVLAGSLQA